MHQCSALESSALLPAGVPNGVPNGVDEGFFVRVGLKVLLCTCPQQY